MGEYRCPDCGRVYPSWEYGASCSPSGKCVDRHACYERRISRLTRELEKLRGTTNWACEKCGNPRSSAPCVHCELAEANGMLDEVEVVVATYADHNNFTKKWNKEPEFFHQSYSSHLRKILSKRKAGAG